MIASSLIVETVAIGDELLTGKISDTNSTFVANHLFGLGIRLERQTVVADDIPKMKAVLEERSSKADIIICFGGLGPTSDDKTAECVAQMTGSSLVEHPPSRERLERFVKERNRVLTPQILKQVVYPSNTEPLFNDCGLAVGFSMKLGQGTFFFLPGVPDEMKAMFLNHVLPRAKALAEKGERYHSHVWRCLEIPESELQRLMDPIERALPGNAWLGYRTQYPENHLTLYFKSKEEPESFAAWKSKIKELVKPYVYAEGNRKIEEEVFDLLKKKNQTIAFVESCTGGLTCQRLSQIPGVSAFLKGGLTPYNFEIKNQLLGLNLKSNEEAVSAECAKDLAVKGKEKFKADWVASVTGYVGPTGGTSTHPVGTIYLGVMGKTYREKKIFQPWRDRAQAQWGAASHLLNLVRAALNSD